MFSKSQRIPFTQSSLRVSAKGFMKTPMLIRRMISVAALTLLLGVLAHAGQQESASVQITEQDLLGGLKNPSRWLTFSGDYTGQRHSPLKQLTPQKFAGLLP